MLRDGNTLRAGQRMSSLQRGRSPIALVALLMLSALLVWQSLNASQAILGDLVVIAAICLAVAWVYLVYDENGLRISGALILPWLLVMNALIPPVSRTIFTAIVVALWLLSARPFRIRSAALWLGLMLSAAMIAISIVELQSASQLISALKFALFPAVVLAASSPANRRRIRSFAPILTRSAGCALGFHLLLIATQVTGRVNRYDVNEGLAAQPHEIALLGIVTAAAAVTLVEARWQRVTIVIIGLSASFTTGVRTGVIAAIPLLLLIAYRSLRSNSPTEIIGWIVGILVVTYSGVLGILSDRLTRSEATNEFGSIQTAGSGRGEIYQAVWDGYVHSGPLRWVIGDGLDASLRFTDPLPFNMAVVSHTDLLEVVATFGLVGAISIGLIIYGLFASGYLWQVIAGLVLFGLLNGAIAYSTVVVVGILLAGGGQPRLGSPHSFDHRENYEGIGLRGTTVQAE